MKLADTLGNSNALVKVLEQGCGKIIEEANRAIRIANTNHWELEEDWAENDGKEMQETESLTTTPDCDSIMDPTGEVNFLVTSPGSDSFKDPSVEIKYLTTSPGCVDSTDQSPGNKAPMITQVEVDRLSASSPICVNLLDLHAAVGLA